MKRVRGKGYTLYNGDCREMLQKMIDRGETVQAIISDAPYSLTSIIKRFGKINMDAETKTNKRIKSRSDGYARLVANKGSNGGEKGFLNQAWDGTFIERDPEFWKLCWQVLPPGGYMFIFAHARTYHRTACAIEDAGFDIRNQIVWVHSQDFPKNKFIFKDIDKILGKESKVVGKREHPTLKDKSKVDRQGKQQFHGTNPIKDEWDVYTPVTKEARQAFGYGTATKISTEHICVAQKPLEKGLSIAKNYLKHGVGVLNIHDCFIPFGSSDNARIGKAYRHNASAEYKPETAKNNSKGRSVSLYKPEGRHPSNFIHDGSPEVKSMFEECYAPNAGMFFYCARPTSKEKNAGLDTNNPHPTVKPLALMQFLIRLSSPRGGTILDPFMGSGTTGCAAISQGFKFIGSEMEKDYFPVARKRIKHYVTKQPTMARPTKKLNRKSLKLIPKHKQKSLFD